MSETTPRVPTAPGAAGAAPHDGPAYAFDEEPSSTSVSARAGLLEILRRELLGPAYAEVGVVGIAVGEAFGDVGFDVEVEFLGLFGTVFQDEFARQAVHVYQRDVQLGGDFGRGRDITPVGIAQRAVLVELPQYGGGPQDRRGAFRAGLVQEA